MNLENPQKAQEKKLNELVTLYSKTEYGKNHNTPKIVGIAEYQHSFPLLTYKDLFSCLAQVKEGEYRCFFRNRQNAGS